jgi:Protein of unknown function (DUF1194)
MLRHSKHVLLERGLPGLVLCWLLGLCTAATAQFKPFDGQTVDLELVLAVDVSHSMDREEQRLQREGYVNALRHKNVVKAIKLGPNKRIAVSYMEWGDPGFQAIVMPWRIIASQADADRFANQLATRPIAVAKRTSISSAMRVAALMITRNEITSLRQVIDLSGDGPNNIGEPVSSARRDVIGQGIIINGLPFVVRRPTNISSFFAVPDIDQYYKECVIGGNGAFTMPVHDKTEFTTAIRRKLINEIAGRFYPKAVVHKAQHQTALRSYDCLAGEKLWDSFQKE